MLASLSYVEVPAGTSVAQHDHATQHLCIVLSGGFEENGSNGSQVLGKGRLRLSPPARRNLKFGNTATTCVIAEVSSDWAPQLTRPAYAPTPYWLDQALPRLYAADGQNNELFQYESDLLVTDLVSWLTKADRRDEYPPPWLRKAREFIRESTNAHRVLKLADDAGINRVHFSRCFQTHFGLSMITYVQRLRALRAMTLIRDENLSLAEVAIQAGYCDQSHFSRAIKQFFGSTPGALREKLHSSNTNVDRLVHWPD